MVNSPNSPQLQLPPLHCPVLMVSLPSPPWLSWPSFWQVCLSSQPWMVSLESLQWEFEWAARFEQVAGFVLSFVRVGAGFVLRFVRVDAGFVE